MTRFAPNIAPPIGSMNRTDADFIKQLSDGVGEWILNF